MVSGLLALALACSCSALSSPPPPARSASGGLPSSKLVSRLVAKRTVAPAAGPALSPEEEYAMLDRAFNEDPAYAELFRAKLEDWRALKAEGALEELRGEIDEEAIERADEASRRLQRRRRALSTDLSAPPSGLSPAPTISEAERALLVLREKAAAIDTSASSALSVYALFNEAKDKGVRDPLLLERVLAALSRLREPAYALAALKQYLAWAAGGEVSPTEGFLESFVNSCVSSGLHDAAREAMLLGGERDAFRAARLCLEVYGAAGDSAKLDEVLGRVCAAMDALAVSEINMAVRALGKIRESKRIFGLIERMRALRIDPSEETFEFLANSFVMTVAEDARAKSMKQLPEPSASMPEVVFVGRSNVGKSSLVNYILNRKALASTSATPGHTKKFHFFAVNAERKDLPSFFLVDVPGLGYAEAEESTTDSWRSLLERYLCVRDSLCTVFHLVDARHALTPTDEAMLALVGRAGAERAAEGRRRFSYVVVLTKTDKASPKQRAATERAVRRGCEGAGLGSGVAVIRSSVQAREGRDALWSTLVGDLERFALGPL